MRKYIQITTENKYVYRVPAEVIAKHRAEHYARTDPETTYKDEYDYTMNDDFELQDWFGNNMNWEDVSLSARLHRIPERDFPVIGQDESEIVEDEV